MRITGTAVDYEPAQIGTSCLICDGFIALYYPYEPAIPRICTKCKVLNIGRQDDCPLVPVPPHGRLIDEDALISKINYTDDFYETPFVDWDDILEAPTVIPVDKDGET